MKTISEYIEETSFNTMINEDFVNPHLRKLVKYLHKHNQNFNKIFRFWSLRWDKLDDSVIKEYPATDDIDKIIRKNKPCFVFGVSDGEYPFFIDPQFSYSSLSKDREWDSHKGMTQTEIFDRCKKCDSVVILDYDKAREESGAVNLQASRNAAWSGVIPRNKKDFDKFNWGINNYEDWCKHFAADNIERYKKLIAQAHAEKDNEFEKVSEKINELLQRAMAISTALSKGAEHLEGKAWEVKNMLNYFYGDTYWDSRNSRTAGRKGLLTLVAEYLYNKEQLRSGKDYSPADTEKRNKSILDAIWKICDLVETKIKELEK